MLWVNMVTALLLGLMLVFEPKEEGLMNRPPRPLNEPMLSGRLIFRTALVSVIMLVGAILLFNNEMSYDGASVAQARTTVTNTVVFVQAFYLLNCRSLNRSFFRLPPFSNPMIWVGIVVTTLVQLLFTYAPVFHRLFNTESIPANVWPRILLVGVVTFIIIEIVKYFENRMRGGSVSATVPTPLAVPANS
jgi:magnesium-transporting ATPase (P-type)